MKASNKSPKIMKTPENPCIVSETLFILYFLEDNTCISVLLLTHFSSHFFGIYQTYQVTVDENVLKRSYCNFPNPRQPGRCLDTLFTGPISAYILWPVWFRNPKLQTTFFHVKWQHAISSKTFLSIWQIPTKLSLKLPPQNLPWINVAHNLPAQILHFVPKPSYEYIITITTISSY